MKGNEAPSAVQYGPWHGALFVPFRAQAGLLIPFAPISIRRPRTPVSALRWSAQEPTGGHAELRRKKDDLHQKRAQNLQTGILNTDRCHDRFYVASVENQKFR